MGWGSGSDLMSQIIRGLINESYDATERKKLYSIIVPALENHDWDTIDECFDDDPAFMTYYEEREAKEAAKYKPRRSR